MPLPSSGAISLNQIHIEAGGSSGSLATLNDSDIRDMIAKSSAASNSFNEYYGVSATAPVATFKGRLTTTGNSFPSGSVSLSSGTKIVVVCIQLAGPNNSFVSLGGTNMTLAVRQNDPHPMSATAGGPGPVWGAALETAIYYMVTSASGSTSITGNGGSGRNSLDVYEITGYNSSTPYTTDTAKNTDLDNKERSKALEAAISQIDENFGKIIINFEGTTQENELIIISKNNIYRIKKEPGNN